jgi:hypothetical protein
MNLFRTPALLGLSVAGLSLSSCGPRTAIDTLKFSVDFRDGDGDLGLSGDDIKVAPYNAKTGGFNGGSPQYNYVLRPFKRSGTPGNYTYTKFVLSTEGEYDGTYPRLEKEGARPAPLKGTLTYALPISVDGQVFNPGDTFHFQITIMDRALHTSNTVTTTDVTLKGPK